MNRAKTAQLIDQFEDALETADRAIKGGQDPVAILVRLLIAGGKLLTANARDELQG